MKTVYVIFVLLLSGCATILQPGPDRISVTSKPEGAKVFLDGNPVGVTPMQLAIPRDSEANVRIEKEGFNSYVNDQNKVVAGWFFGNLLLGGVIGMTVDLITHNQGKYKDQPIYVELAPKVAVGN